METGEALKRFRSQFKIQQKDVAQALNIKPQAYQVYEAGKVTPSVEVIKKIAIKFNVSMDYLVGLSDEPRPVPADKKLVDAIKNARDAIQNVLSEVDNLSAD